MSLLRKVSISSCAVRVKRAKKHEISISSASDVEKFILFFIYDNDFIVFKKIENVKYR